MKELAIFGGITTLHYKEFEANVQLVVLLRVINISAVAQFVKASVERWCSKSVTNFVESANMR